MTQNGRLSMESIEEIIRRVVREELERSRLQQVEQPKPPKEPLTVRGGPLWNDPVLTPEMVARKIGVSVSTLANWRSNARFGKAKGPPFIKMGQLVRYYEREVDQWMQGHG